MDYDFRQTCYFGRNLVIEASGKVLKSNADPHTGQATHQAGAFLQFQWHEATRSILLPPVYDVSLLQGNPQH